MQRNGSMNDIVPQEGIDIVNYDNDDLSRIVHKALANIEAILDMEIPEVKKHEDMARYLSLKKDAATAIINAGLKADENRFRRENKDIIERLFDKIKKDGKIVDGRLIK